MYKSTIPDEVKEVLEYIKPTGYRMIVALALPEEKTTGGIIRPDELLQKEQVAAPIGYVCAQGPDCYKHPGKFPSGPWCKVGDWISFKSYSGQRIKTYNGIEFRIMNDDVVESVITNPSKFNRF